MNNQENTQEDQPSKVTSLTDLLNKESKEIKELSKIYCKMQVNYCLPYGVFLLLLIIVKFFSKDHLNIVWVTGLLLLVILFISWSKLSKKINEYFDNNQLIVLRELENSIKENKIGLETTKKLKYQVEQNIQNKGDFGEQQTKEFYVLITLLGVELIAAKKFSYLLMHDFIGLCIGLLVLIVILICIDTVIGNKSEINSLRLLAIVLNNIEVEEDTSRGASSHGERE